MTTRRSLIAVGGCFAGAALGSSPSAAQGSAAGFPSKPVNLVVPFANGGQADLVARALAPALSLALKGPVEVSNRPGANGTAGGAFVAASPPDGHTLLVHLTSFLMLPEADVLNGRKPGYTTEQFVPVAMVGADSVVLAVPASSPWKSVQEFVADAKRRPNEILYGSAGNYSTLHVAMELFADTASIKLEHVPFQGAGPALQSLVSNRVHALASGPGPLKNAVTSGQIRILACFGAERHPDLPAVPTFKESGFNDLEFYLWTSLFAPVRTRPDVLSRLREAIGQAASSAEFKSAMASSGSNVRHLSGDELDTFLAADSARLLRTVQRIGKVS